MQQITEVIAKPGFRSAAANLGWLLGERAIRFFLGVGVGFWVARRLGPAGLGQLSYAVAIVTLAGVAAALGVDAVIKRDLLLEPGEARTLVASGALLKLVAGVASYGVGIVGFQAFSSASSDERRLLWIIGLTLLQPALIVPDLWLQANLRSKVSVIAQTLALGLTAGVRVALIATHAPLEGFAWALVLESVLAGIGILLFSRRAGFVFSWSDARLAVMSRLLRESWPLAFASLAIVVYMKIDEVMLRQLAGASAVGFYSAATRLTEIWYFVPMALAGSLLPALMRARSQGELAYKRRLQGYYDLNAGIGYLLSVPLALAAPVIVRLAYGEAFAPSAAIAAVHVWSSVFVFIGVARGQWLVNERLQGFYLCATLAGAITNIGLNLLFIPRWGGLGAAIATVVAQALASWLSSFCLAATRETAWMQTRALLLPVLGYRYLRRP